MNKNSAIFYSGPSMIDQRAGRRPAGDIIGIITGLERDSKNKKTGAMLQTFILIDDVKNGGGVEWLPSDNVMNGRDQSVCGNCPRRPYLIDIGRSKKDPCYVEILKSVNSVYRSYANGQIVRRPDLLELIEQSGRSLRCGSYGDPAAIPATIWEAMILHATGHTGYSHEWKKRAATRLYSGFLMASVDDVKEQRQANAAGWSTFRVADDLATGFRLNDQSRTDLRSLNESPCPAPYSNKVTCAKCLGCSGSGIFGRSKNYVIPSH